MMSRISRGALLGVAVGIAGIVASNTPLGLNLEENQGLEVLFLLRGHRTPPPDVVVVSIDKESADQLAQDDDVTNWPRTLHADLTEKLAGSGAAVIAFDVFFEEFGDMEGDIAFAEAMRKAKNVVLCERIQSEKVVVKNAGGAPGGQIEIARRFPPIFLFANSSVASSPYPLPKIPVKVSRDWMFRAGRRVPAVCASRVRRFSPSPGRGLSRPGKQSPPFRGGNGPLAGIEGDDPGRLGDLRA
jgi:adenylate cyclase